jgi:hypothetical protein
VQYFFVLKELRVTALNVPLNNTVHLNGKVSTIKINFFQLVTKVLRPLMIMESLVNLNLLLYIFRCNSIEFCVPPGSRFVFIPSLISTMYCTEAT